MKLIQAATERDRLLIRIDTLRVELKESMKETDITRLDESELRSIECALVALAEATESVRSTVQALRRSFVPTQLRAAYGSEFFDA